jgi:hypothetical protein
MAPAIVLHESGAAEVFGVELTGTVWSGARLREQSPEPLGRIRTTIIRMLDNQYRMLGGHVLPTAMFVVARTRK